MAITLYRTDLKPEYNGRYESLETYLANCDSAVLSDFQYIKPALQTYIKVPMSGYRKTQPYNYLKVNQEGRIYYYFVSRIHWVAEGTLGMTITMDTVNTFWDDITFTANTHITRKYGNRFAKQSVGGLPMLIPIIDKYAEDINNPPLVRSSITRIGNEALWYVVQKTDYLSSDSLASNPVSTYILCDEKYPIPEMDPTVIYPENISSNTNAYAFPLSTVKTEIKVITQNDVTQIYTISRDSDVDYGYYWYENGQIRMKLHSTTSTSNRNLYLKSITLTNVGSVFLQPYDFVKESSSDIYYVNSNISLGTEIAYNSYVGGDAILPFNEWYENNKTDGTIVKISCLPYQPVDFDSLQNGVDYIGTANGIKLINPNIEYRYTFTDRMATLTTYGYTVVDPTKSYNLKYETKKYNSNYYQIHYAFDNNILSYNLDSFSIVNKYFSSIDMNIDFIYNKEMSNSLGFKFTIPSTLKYDYTTDFGDYIICNKSLDVPYYTNEYLNYLRYGKAVDERNAGFSAASTLLGGLSTGIGATASTFAAGTMAKLAAAGPLGWASAAVGAASTAVGFVSSLVKNRDSINQKIDSYTHQASSVNGTSDLSIFKTYGKNKLLRFEYNMPAYLNDSILNYFRLYGYSTDKYQIPDFTTRYWSNYVVMEPDFEANYVDSDYMDDIKARCQAGLRVYHWHDKYDLNNTLENWETSLI